MPETLTKPAPSPFLSCVVCREPFAPKSPRQLCCSPDCSRENNTARTARVRREERAKKAQERGPLLCANAACGKSFMPRNDRHFTCCPACGVAKHTADTHAAHSAARATVTSAYRAGQDTGRTERYTPLLTPSQQDEPFMRTGNGHGTVARKARFAADAALVANGPATQPAADAFKAASEQWCRLVEENGNRIGADAAKAYRRGEWAEARERLFAGGE